MSQNEHIGSHRKRPLNERECGYLGHNQYKEYWLPYLKQKKEAFYPSK